MSQNIRSSLRFFFALAMVASLAVGGTLSAIAEDASVATPPVEQPVVTEPTAEPEVPTDPEEPVEPEPPIAPEEPVEPENPVAPEEPVEPETPVIPEDEDVSEGVEGEEPAQDALDVESKDTGSSLQLVEPLAQVPGTVITLSDPTPVSEDPTEWAFRITSSDASITTVTVEFANGNVVRSNFAGSSHTRIARITSNLDSTVVSAVTHSALPDSGAQLEVLRGPFNAQPDDQLHTATISVVPAVAGLNWTLTSTGGATVASGVTDDSGVITVVDLPATGYTVTVTDPDGNYHSGGTFFSVVNADVSASVTLREVADNLWIEFQVSGRGEGRLSGATVILLDANGAFVVEGETDANGVLRLENLRGGTYIREVSADGYTTQRTTFELTGTAVTGIALDPVTSVTLSGFVGDASDSEGIPGATVTLVGSDAVGTTDEDGNYVIEDAPGGYWDATFTAPGYQPVTMRAVLTNGEEFTLNAMLIPVATEEITLRVITSDGGNPAGTTYIVAQGDRVLFEGTFDETGQALIGNLPVGQIYDVHVDGEPAGYSFEVDQHAVVRGYNTWTVSLEALPTEQAMTLTVVTSDAGSPEGAIVTLSQNDNIVDTFDVDETGVVALGDLTIGESYVVSVDGEPAGYLPNSGSYTVVRDAGTWAIEINPIPTLQAMTLNVITSDDGSPEGALFTLSLNGVVVLDGEVDETGEVALGELAIGESYIVSVDGESIGYLPTSGSYTLVRDAGTWAIEIAPLPTEQAMTLHVFTADDGSPEGAVVTLSQDGVEIGTFDVDETGVVALGELTIGESYLISVDGEPAGYQSIAGGYTVVRDETAFGILLHPVVPVPTEAITLAVTTADEGSPEGATYVITEAAPDDSEISLFLTATPITGTLPASGVVEVGDLAIGTSYTVAIDGAPAGYQNASVTFEVVEGEGTWNVVLQPLAEEPVPTDPVPTDPVKPAPEDPKAPKVTGLPETGTGTSGNSNAITLFATGSLALLMLGAFVNRVQRPR